MSLTIFIPQPETPTRLRQSAEASVATPSGRLPGGALADKVALKQMITLCPLHLGKFNPRAAGYELWRALYTVAECCWGSRHIDLRCKTFIHESTHDQVGDWTRRRRGRWASR